MARKRQVEWFWRIGSEIHAIPDELLFRSGFGHHTVERFWEPRVDVCESETAILVIAEIAGLESKDISVSFSPDRHSLILRGFRGEEPIEGERRVRCYQLEIYFGDFLREVTLPDMPLDTDNITAGCRNGFLVIKVPKVKEDRERRTIPVEEG